MRRIEELLVGSAAADVILLAILLKHLCWVRRLQSEEIAGVVNAGISDSEVPESSTFILQVLIVAVSV